jgi:hypothetical protein
VTACLSAFLFGVLLGFPPTLVAQEGSVHVRVRGDVGPLSGATVDLLQGGRVARSSLTDAAGGVRFTGLTAGVYQVRVQAPGHRAHPGEPFSLSVGERRVVEVEMLPEAVELEGITVRVDPIQIRREDADFATLVEERTIGLLPVAYDARELVALTPGARAENVWGGANFQANSYQIDGLGANHPGLGGSLFEPSTNWIERVEVRGLGAGAEHGGFQGGQVNVVTKSGGEAFSAMLRTMVSADPLSGSNLVLSEIGSEVKTRVDLEGEVRGPLIPDRLLYYLGGTYIDRSSRVLNHVDFQSRFLPVEEGLSVRKGFGKLTWTPDRRNRVNFSGAYFGNRVNHYGLTGYEGPGATSDRSSPTWFGSVDWRRLMHGGAILEARVNRFQQDSRTEPAQGKDAPGVKLWALTPPYYVYRNDPLTLHSASSSSSAEVAWSLPVEIAGEEHALSVGGEVTRGKFLDRRTRNGGMTWMPVEWEGLDPEDPSTWANPEEGYVPTEWGGEVDLDSEVLNTAAFVQGSLSFGRFALSPGVRWGTWRGWVNPATGEKFQAVEDQAFDLRIGATLSLTEAGTTVLKGHWGRYHQDLIGQMFDRAAGPGAFTDQEIWYYHGDGRSLPPTSFTEEERDALAGGVFTKESAIFLNETGPVTGYRQPYIDQWLVGLERQFGRSVKFEALFTRRTNHDMIALVDRNRETNFTHFERVRVHMGGTGGAPLPRSGQSGVSAATVFMTDLYVPNNVVLEELRYCAANPGVCELPPGLSLADTASLSWNPDYVLTMAPDATRGFWQLQLGFDFSRPDWGGALSLVWTGLKGNLDNVSGYADPAEFGPGPYVRLNEGVNAFGSLPNFAETEGKISLWGQLPGGFKGGAFLTSRSGDRYSPQFRISAQRSQYGYKANAGPGRHCYPSDPTCEEFPGDPLPIQFFQPLEGQDVFIGPRGNEQTERYSSLDLRVERVFEFPSFSLGLAFDLFNALGVDSVTEVQNLLNHGQRLGYYHFEDASTSFRKLWAGKWFGSPLERAAPRRLRVGMTAYF